MTLHTAIALRVGDSKMHMDLRCKSFLRTSSCCRTFITKQVVFWGQPAVQYSKELAAQQEVFGGEHGEQRHKDFKYVIGISLRST